MGEGDDGRKCKREEVLLEDGSNWIEIHAARDVPSLGCMNHTDGILGKVSCSWACGSINLDTAGLAVLVSGGDTFYSMSEINQRTGWVVVPRGGLQSHHDC